MFAQRDARINSPGEAGAGSGVLGRTNNFKLAFLPDSDTTIGGLAGKLLRDSLGSVWTKFVEERPDLVQPALRAVGHEVLRLREFERESSNLTGDNDGLVG